MNFVTGGTGLIGSHLLFDLVEKGEPIRAIRRKNSDLDMVRKVFAFYNADNAEELFRQIEWVEADILDPNSIYDVMEGVKDVYHCAAIVSYDPADAEKLYRANVEGTANVVNAALERKVRKCCFVSSTAAIGKPAFAKEAAAGRPASAKEATASEPASAKMAMADEPAFAKGAAADEHAFANMAMADEHTPWKMHPGQSRYSISKYLSEREVWRAGEEGLSMVIVNPCLVIGPGAPGRSSLALFSGIHKGMKYYTGGMNAFVDARDVSAAMIQLINSDISHERFVIASENLPLKQVMEWIADGLDKPRPHIKVSPLMSQMAWRIEKVKSLITGQKPLITRETASTAFRKTLFSNEKVKKALNMKFIPVERSVKEACRFFTKEFSR